MVQAVRPDQRAEAGGSGTLGLIIVRHAALVSHNRNRRSLGRHLQRSVHGERILLAIGNLLAHDTVRSPWDRHKTLQSDVLFTTGADAKRTCIDPAESRSHLPQPVGFTLKGAHSAIAIVRVLGAIQFIGTRLDRKSFSAPASVSEFCLFIFQGPSKGIQLRLCHSYRSFYGLAQGFAQLTCLPLRSLRCLNALKNHLIPERVQFQNGQRALSAPTRISPPATTEYKQHQQDNQ